MNYAHRRQALWQGLEPTPPAALLIRRPAHLRYLTGYAGHGGSLLLSPQRTELHVDPAEAAWAQTTLSVEVIPRRRDWPLDEIETLVRRKVDSLGLDAAGIGLTDGQRILKDLRLSDWTDLDPLLLRLRSIKDADELLLLRRAARLAEASLAEVMAGLTPSMSELDVVARLEAAARRRGGQGFAFPTYVAAGRRTAWAHGMAGSTHLIPEDLVLLDFGPCLEGYGADLTRMCCLGRARQPWPTVLEAVLAASEEVCRRCRPGVTAGELADVGHIVLEEAGFGEVAPHALGHGVGLEVHEPPFLQRGNRLTLEGGMVLAIEPGVYLPGRAGVRIENMVLVTPQGGEPLTQDLGGDLARGLLEE